MTDLMSLVSLVKVRYPAASGITADLTFVDRSPVAGTVASVTYIPVAALSGADTNTRTLSLVNKKADASGTTVIATYALTNGHDLVAFVGKAITLSSTAADLVVAAGDVLAWTSTHASSGLTDPGGTVEVAITRTA